MARINDHYLKLRSSYLFTEIAASLGPTARRRSEPVEEREP